MERGRCENEIKIKSENSDIYADKINDINESRDINETNEADELNENKRNNETEKLEDTDNENDVLQDMPELTDMSIIEDERSEALNNKHEGMRREAEAEVELKEKYPESEGYKILREVYIRDEDGKKVKDPESGECRRNDFVVVKDDKVVAIIEVTSKTVDKTKQMSKEQRILENGGKYYYDRDGNRYERQNGLLTKLDMRD